MRTPLVRGADVQGNDKTKTELASLALIPARSSGFCSLLYQITGR